MGYQPRHHLGGDEVDNMNFKGYMPRKFSRIHLISSDSPSSLIMSFIFAFFLLKIDFLSLLKFIFFIDWAMRYC